MMAFVVKGKSSKRNLMSPSGKWVWTVGGLILSYSESGRSSSDAFDVELLLECDAKWFTSVWRRRKFLTDILCKEKIRRLREKVLRSTRRKRNWGEMREDGGRETCVEESGYDVTCVLQEKFLLCWFFDPHPWENWEKSQKKLREI